MHTGHHHGPPPAQENQRRLTITLVLAGTYMLAEALGGWLTGSLALLADAGHMLSDVIALTLGVAALRIAQRPSGSQRTYGYQRAEILAALLQGVLLVGVSVSITVEAIERLGEPRALRGGPMLLVAAGGLVVNLIGLRVLNAGRRDNLNVRGAWLHVLSDALGSLGAMIAGALVLAYGWYWADPLASLAIAALIVRASWGLLREALDVLMETAPPHVDVDEIRGAMASLPGVLAVHDLHVWTITSGMTALSGHVVAKDGGDHARLLREVTDLLRRRFHIEHATIQIEPRDFEEPGAVCEE